MFMKAVSSVEISRRSAEHTAATPEIRNAGTALFIRPQCIMATPN
jgi:hypothetical protein